MNIEELSIQLENAVANLYVIQAALRDSEVNRETMANALLACYDHLNAISQAITGIVENCPAEIICKCVEGKKI